MGIKHKSPQLIQNFVILRSEESQQTRAINSDCSFIAMTIFVKHSNNLLSLTQKFVILRNEESQQTRATYSDYSSVGMKMLKKNPTKFKII
jgi:hypothetical protein